MPFVALPNVKCQKCLSQFDQWSIQSLGFNISTFKSAAVSYTNTREPELKTTLFLTQRIKRFRVIFQSDEQKNFCVRHGSFERH